MTFEYFKRFIDTYQANHSSLDKLYKLGFDFLENENFPLYNHLAETLELFIKSHYNNDGWEWVGWFIYENDFGKSNLRAHDENGNLICQTLEELYVLLETQYKL